MTDVIKDVHTEHCCAQHGCKYADSDCPVASGNKPQSYPCESCEWEKEDAARHTAAKDAEIEALRADAERLDWLSQLDVGICHLGHGDYQWYSYANPKPERGMLGLRAAIDAAREARND